MGIAADVPNGLYVNNVVSACEALADSNNSSFFRMTSTKEAGGVLINYSDRFSISGLTGDTALRIRQAAQALDGNTDGPSVAGDTASTSTTSNGGSSTTASSTASSSTAATASTTTLVKSTEASDTASASSTELPDDEKFSSGLSKGATAGIAVAVTTAVIGAFAALLSFLYIRRRKKQNEVQEISTGTAFQPKPMSELSAEELLTPKSLWTHTTELSSESMVYEAGSGERPPELDHMAFRAELEGSQPTTPK